MNILKLENIEKKDSPLSYRNEYFANVIFKTNFGKNEENKKIHFILERSPLGHVFVKIEILDSLDFPILLLYRIVKNHILELDKIAKLP